MKNRAIQFTIFLLLAGSLQVNLFAQEDAAVTAIRQILQERIDKNKKSVGIVVGLIDKNGSHVVGYGKLSQEKNQEPDGSTVYEIGSITKVFTSILLQDMVERGEVNSDDRICRNPSKSPPETAKKSRCGIWRRILPECHACRTILI